MADEDWIKIDLHIHTLDDPKDALDYSAHELLERARALGFSVLAITLHDAVFDRAEVFADAARMGILLIPATEVRLEGADVILLNVSAQEISALRALDDLEALRGKRGQSVFTIAPHPFYVLGGSIGETLVERIDCFDAIEQSEPARPGNRRTLRQAAHRHLGCAPPPCFRLELPQYSAPCATDGGKRNCRFADRTASRNESALFVH